MASVDHSLHTTTYPYWVWDLMYLGVAQLQLCMLQVINPDFGKGTEPLA